MIPATGMIDVKMWAMEPKSREEVLADIEIAEQNVILMTIELEAQRVRLRASQRRWWPLFFLSFFGSALIFAAILAVAWAYWR